MYVSCVSVLDIDMCWTLGHTFDQKCQCYKKKSDEAMKPHLNYCCVVQGFKSRFVIWVVTIVFEVVNCNATPIEAASATIFNLDSL
jgi:hypothetical protein